MKNHKGYFLFALLLALTFTAQTQTIEKSFSNTKIKLKMGISYPWITTASGEYYGRDFSFPINSLINKKLKAHLSFGFKQISKHGLKYVRFFLLGSGEFYYGKMNRPINRVFLKNLKTLVKLANKYSLNLILVLFNHKILYKEFEGQVNPYFHKEFQNAKWLKDFIKNDLFRLMLFLKQNNDSSETKISFEIFNEPEFLFSEFILIAENRFLVSMKKIGNIIKKIAISIRKFNKKYKTRFLVTTGMINPLKPWIHNVFYVRKNFKKWVKFLRDVVKLDYFQVHVYGKKGKKPDLHNHNDTVDIFYKSNNKYILKDSPFYTEIISKNIPVYIGEYPINLKTTGYSLKEINHHTKNLNIKGIFFWSYCVNDFKHGVFYGKLENKAISHLFIEQKSLMELFSGY